MQRFLPQCNLARDARYFPFEPGVASQAQVATQKLRMITKTNKKSKFDKSALTFVMLICLFAVDLVDDFSFVVFFGRSEGLLSG